MGTGVPSTRPILRGSPLTAVMVVCFRSISARTSDGMGTFNCWCCWRMGLCFDVEKRLGSGEDTTQLTPASSGWPRRRMETASRVSKSTPCVRCVQPCARRLITEPCARLRTMLSVRLPTTKSCDWATRRRRGCQIDAAPFGLSRAPSCARRSCTCGGCPRRFARERPAPLQALSRCHPSRKPGLTLLRASRSGAEGLPGEQ